MNLDDRELLLRFLCRPLEFFDGSVLEVVAPNHHLGLHRWAKETLNRRPAPRLTLVGDRAVMALRQFAAREEAPKPVPPGLVVLNNSKMFTLSGTPTPSSLTLQDYHPSSAIAF